MKYVAQKCCKFQGKPYKPGDIVPADVFPPYMARKLVFNGIIVELEGEESPEALLAVPILDDALVDNVEISVENLIPVLVALQKNSQEAICDMEAFETEEQIILLRSLDSRKGVISAVDKHLQEVKSTEKTQMEEEGEA